MYRSSDEVEKALADRSKAEAVMQRVNKGGKGSFTYIPWNETVRLLDDIFGPFGWSLRIVGSYNDFERGIYRTDVELTVSAVNAEEQVVRHKVLAGTGVGIVVGQSQDAHDTAIKASRSDALSVAAKSLGNAFGLFLYDRGDPARTEGTSTNNQSAPARQAVPTNGGKDLGFRPSEKQSAMLAKNGYTAEQVSGLTFKEWKAVLDALFAHETPPISPAAKANKVAPVKPAKQAEPEELDLDSMFG